MGPPNTSSQVIELNPSCFEQAQSNRQCTGPGYENTEPVCILAVLYVPSIVCPLRNAMPSLARLFKRFCTAGTQWASRS